MQDLLVAISGDMIELAKQIRSPATVLTNLLIAAQCGLQARRCSRRAREAGSEARAWRDFFVWIGVSALLGSLKHGTPGLIDPALHTAISLASNLALGIGVAVLQRVLVELTPTTRAAWGLLFVLAAGVSAVAGSFVLAGVAVALGMLPVVAAGVTDAAGGQPGGRELAAAWVIAAVAGVTWVVGPIPADWFGRIDVAHMVLSVALGFVLLGSERRVGRGPLLPRPT